MLKHAMIATALTAFITFSAGPSFAQNTPEETQAADPRVEELLNKLPDAAQINDIMADMPDMNVMLDGMIELAEDEELHASLERAGARLEQRFENMDLERANGRPDMNAAMTELMSLTTDRELMGEMFSLMFMVSDHMEEVMDEATD